MCKTAFFLLLLGLGTASQKRDVLKILCESNLNSVWLNGKCECLGCQNNSGSSMNCIAVSTHYNLTKLSTFEKLYLERHYSGCQNGGTPTDAFRLGGTKEDRRRNRDTPCHCPERTTGRCCENLRCSNGGKTTSSGRCDCPPKFTGRWCEEEVIHRCENGGVLNRRENKCTCSNPFSGRTCESPNCWNGGKPANRTHCTCRDTKDGLSYGQFCREIPCFHGKVTEVASRNVECRCSIFGSGPACREWTKYFWLMIAGACIATLIALGTASFYFRRWCKYGTLSPALTLPMAPALPDDRKTAALSDQYNKLLTADSVKNTLPAYKGPGAPRQKPGTLIDSVAEEADRLFASI